MSEYIYGPPPPPPPAAPSRQQTRQQPGLPRRPSRYNNVQPNGNINDNGTTFTKTHRYHHQQPPRKVHIPNNRILSQSGIGPEQTQQQYVRNDPLGLNTSTVVEDEDEEKFSTKKGAIIPIPGTSITLESEEDIAEWIAQRRKNWPSTQRVEEKQKQKQNKQQPDNEDTDPTQQQKKRRPCVHFARGHCRLGGQCRFLHESTTVKNHHDLPSKRYARFAPPEQLSLYTRMVQSDYDMENELVLDAIQLFADHGLIKEKKKQIN